MQTKIGYIISRTKSSVCNFKKDPVGNLGFLIPITICLTSFISGIITYIIFIVRGGYLSQVGLIKESGVDGIFDGFTSGTVEMMRSGITAKIILILVIAELIVMLISYFKSRGKRMRIAMIVDLAILVIMIALSNVIFWMAVGKLVLLDEQIYLFLMLFEGITIKLKAIFITYAVVLLVSVICFIVFSLITNECRWMFGYTAFSVLIINTVVPLFFWLLQNVIPLVGAIFVIVVGFLVIKFIFSIFADHPENIEGMKLELRRAKERSSNYKASADANLREARNGLNLIFSAETKREWARDDMKKAEYEDKEIRHLEKEIERLESKFGKQD